MRSLKLKNKFLHPRWDAASGVLIAEIISRYYPETGPGYILPVPELEGRMKKEEWRMKKEEERIRRKNG